MGFQTFHKAFENLLGSNPQTNLLLEDNRYPFAHEAGVYIPSTKQIFISSNRIQEANGAPKVQISKISIAPYNTYTHDEINPGIHMANGAVNYNDGVLFCSQGTPSHPSCLIYMEAQPPYKTTTVLDSFYGRQFNSLNDVVVHADGSIWFTDPIYGYEQGFRTRPQLPGQVYRYDPQTQSVRVVADGFGRPNGIAFSPDQEVVYITDTDCVHGDGSVDLSRPSTIYAFDVMYRSNKPFLSGRRVFAMADNGVPDGIKVDLAGNVFSGCGDGIHVWSPGGDLLGKILISGGVSNFCFTEPGMIVALNETQVWEIRLDSSCRGALLGL